MEYRDRTFENEDVLLDGNTFTGCTFRGCRMIYNAIMPVIMAANRFEDVHWVMNGPASLALDFMTALYHGAGEGGRHVIEQAFEQIRRGRPADA